MSEINDTEKPSSKFWNSKALSGLWIVCVGIFFFLSNSGYISGEVLSKLWPLLIIIPGLFHILRSNK